MPLVAVEAGAGAGDNVGRIVGYLGGSSASYFWQLLHKV